MGENRHTNGSWWKYILVTKEQPKCQLRNKEMYFREQNILNYIKHLLDPSEESAALKSQGYSSQGAWKAQTNRTCHRAASFTLLLSTNLHSRKLSATWRCSEYTLGRKQILMRYLRRGERSSSGAGWSKEQAQEGVCWLYPCSVLLPAYAPNVFYSLEYMAYSLNKWMAAAKVG